MAITLPSPHPTDLPSHSVGYQPPKSDGRYDPVAIAQQWLDGFAHAANTGDGKLFQSLFLDNAYWRDVLAFTNDFRSIRTVNVANAASAVFPEAKADKFALVKAEIEHPFPDVTFLAFHFNFSTALGPCYGVARLVWEPQSENWKAWTCFTLLEGIHDQPQRMGEARVRGSHNDRESYDDRREEEQEYKYHSPDVLIIGGGHNGLATAAQLKSLGIDALVVDTFKRIGDNWRLRYRSLSLHDPVHANHLPFIPFPSTWPTYTPAGKLANFLEAYVEILELNVWTQTTVDPARTSFNHKTGKWDVTVVRKRANGDVKERAMSVSHVVLATGLGGGKPKMPAPFPGQAEWDGVAVHSSGHASGESWKGKKALVVGACTSGHDISADFAKNGVDVTMLQRTPTFIMSVDKGQEMMVAGTYNERVAHMIDHQDRLGESNPKFVAKLIHKRIIPKLAEADKELLDGLAERGFKAWPGPEGTGFLMMALEKAGGYYYSTGGSEMIVNGEIKVKQGEISSFEQDHTVVFKDGSKEQFDVVVFATGYTGFPDTVRATLGEQYAETFNPVWGLDAEGEIRGVARESNIPNMFFLVGALAGSRVMSKVLALQIAAQRAGKWRERYTWQKQKERGELVDDTVYRAYEGLTTHPQPIRDGE